MQIKNKKLYVKKFIVTTVGLIVLGLTIYFVSLKWDALLFAFMHTHETRIAEQRYNEVQFQAKRAYEATMATKDLAQLFK